MLYKSHSIPKNQDPIHSRTSPLAWRRDGAGWLLFAGRRRFGSVMPDSERVGMWRSRRTDSRLSDMANLSWAKSAALIAAERELAFEATEVRQRRAIDPSNCPERGGVFDGSSLLVRSNAPALVRQRRKRGAIL